MGGKTKDIKRVWKYYTLADYEKEEQFLTKMAAQGWRFVDTNGFLYTFERCEPEQVAYRIDYSGLHTNERDDYYAMFRDFGWEYLQDINGFSYFRKNGKGISPEELELFSDDKSRIDMMKRILLTKLLPVLLLWTSSASLILNGCIRKLHEPEYDAMDWSMIVFGIFMIVLEILLTVHMLGGFIKLKKKYNKAV